MTQTASPLHHSALAPDTTLSIHGVDPDTHVPVTWHVTSPEEDGVAGTYLVERAVGDIRSPALWMQAQRDAKIVGLTQVLDLVHRVLEES